MTTRPALVVDGYNVIHAWPQLKSVLARGGLEESRRALVALLADYAAVQRVRVTVVFDGARGQVGVPTREVVDGVEVRFSGGGVGGSADHLIERLAYEASRQGGAERVTVATSDRLQRDLVRAMGVVTVDARTLEVEVAAAAADTGARARRSREQAGFARRVEHHLDDAVLERLEALRRGRTGTPPGAAATPEEQGVDADADDDRPEWDDAG